ncbi:uncharacterized protein LOC127261976 [Andrographis paniculata]|uniref:uncharacterized protein LOC127261976 n=1 Tax=Andrographis paniculata TaxID=175694 RepID=UPI0021E7B2C7|nr:uncharacterized protein LOC127261976 [Andrographis paniculata]
MAPFKALYGRKCRTPLCWSDLSKRVVLRPEMIEEMMNQIRNIKAKMKAAQDRQKSYADLSRRDGHFKVGDHVLLKVSPTKGVRRFGIKGKLSPRYVGPYEIIKRIGEVAYRLALPETLKRVHDVFHVSQLRRYVADPSHILQPEVLDLPEDLVYSEQPIQIVAFKVRSTRNCEIRMVKVVWSQHGIEEAAWETEQKMRGKYPE